MYKNIFLVLFFTLLGCRSGDRCKVPVEYLSDYQALYPSYSTDSTCANELSPSEKRKVYISFSNTWDEKVVVTKGGKVVFCDSIVTNKSAGITYKGFVVTEKSSNDDSIIVYLNRRKVWFKVNFSYNYRYVKLYRIADDVLQEYGVEDPIRVKATNCNTMIF